MLKHQTVSIHDSDPITFVHVLRHFTRNGYSVGEYTLDLKLNQIRNDPVVRGLNRMMMITQSRFTSQYHKAIQSHTSELLLWYEVYQYDLNFTQDRLEDMERPSEQYTINLLRPNSNLIIIGSDNGLSPGQR